MSSQMYNTSNDRAQSLSLQQKGSVLRGSFSRAHTIRTSTTYSCNYSAANCSRSPVIRFIGIFCAAASVGNRADCWDGIGSSDIYYCYCTNTEECNDVAASGSGGPGSCCIVSFGMHCTVVLLPVLLAIVLPQHPAP